MGAAQLQASQEQCESLESKRASLANALHKLEAFQRNILNTLQASDQVTPFVALSQSAAPLDCLQCGILPEHSVVCRCSSF